MTVYVETPVEFVFNGCCANLGLNSLTISNTVQTICSTILPTTTGEGFVKLIGGCSC